MNENTRLVSNADGSDDRWTRERILIVSLNAYNSFMMSSFYTVVVPLLPLYAKDHGFGKLGQGLVIASLQIGWFLGLPIVNKLWLRPRTVVCIGAAAYSFAPALVVCYPSLWTLVISRIAEGVASCMLMVLMTSVMAREIPPSIRGRAFGLRSFIGSFGLFVGPAVGGFLYPVGGLRLPMLILATFGFLGLLAYLSFVDDRWFQAHEERLAAKEAQGISMFTRFSTLMSDSELRWLFSTHFFSWCIMSSLWMAVPQLLQDAYRLTPFMTSSFWVVCDLCTMIGALMGGVLVDKLSPWIMFFASSFLQHTAQFLLVAITFFQPTGALVFLFACGVVFFFGTTDGGVLGPPYMKLLTCLEEDVLVPRSRSSTVEEDEVAHLFGGKTGELEDRLAELLSMKEFVCSVAMTIGPLYAGSMYGFLGFPILIVVLVVLSAVVDVGSAWGTQHARKAESFVSNRIETEVLAFSRQVS